jgi:hypothetical protein
MTQEKSPQKNIKDTSNNFTDEEIAELEKIIQGSVNSLNDSM